MVSLMVQEFFADSPGVSGLYLAALCCATLRLALLFAHLPSDCQLGFCEQCRFNQLTYVAYVGVTDAYLYV